MPPRLIFGFHPVREELAGPAAGVARVLVAAGAGKRRDEIEALAAARGVALERVSGETLDELTGGAVHNGFVAELVAGTAGRTPGGDPELVVLVEDVQDPRNLGALLRVCDGAGVGRVLVRDRGSAPLSPAAVKASAGAAGHLEIERVTNSAREIERLKRDGFWVYGAAAEGEPVWDVDLTGKLCLALGGEERGLRRRTRGLCDRLVALPMRGRVASLNLATAAAAVLYEALRQRRG